MKWKLTVLATIKRVSLVVWTLSSVEMNRKHESLDFSLQGSKKTDTRLLWAGLVLVRGHGGASM